MKSANIDSSAVSCTTRRGASPAEGTGWGSWRGAFRTGEGGAGSGRVDDTHPDEWKTPDRMTLGASVAIFRDANHRIKGQR
ncbi:hypothetical protein GCM10012286_28900 [Streptomyces lasiicapitis]|uniref:Uncharacterized protein n=1 Tax=Streptomyces lasiicapitis TaxID=1923961 RepID=A0ABQ2LWJ9_9ACTN|nr:hypothetical protein GCM10012286_28900 [Streptomyces lasiicapitis]